MLLPCHGGEASVTLEVTPTTSSIKNSTKSPDWLGSTWTETQNSLLQKSEAEDLIECGAVSCTNKSKRRRKKTLSQQTAEPPGTSKKTGQQHSYGGGGGFNAKIGWDNTGDGDVRFGADRWECRERFADTCAHWRNRLPTQEDAQDLLARPLLHVQEVQKITSGPTGCGVRSPPIGRRTDTETEEALSGRSSKEAEGHHLPFEKHTIKQASTF